MSELTQDQALALITQRAEAQDNLITFAQTIDIPAVPQGVSTNEWDIIDTPLALHHKLVLYALQSMTCKRLLYSPDDLSPITMPTPDGLVMSMVSTTCVTQTAKPPRGGRPDTPSPYVKLHDPSGNHTSETLPLDTMPPYHEDNQLPAISDDPEVPKYTGVVPEFAVGRDAKYTVTEDSLCSGEEPYEYIIEGDIPESLLADLNYRVCSRVMLMMPPGSAKSTYATVVFPAWEMGRTKDTEVILTGWGDPICRKHGKRARKICDDPLYRGIFSTHLDPNTRAAEDWALTNNSTYKSSGINSGVAGFRCDGLVWDDLTKNRKEADSQTIRDDIHNAYIDDARSRKKPDAWEVGIGTRWHEDEIMGRILPEGYAGESGYMRCRDGNVWLVICLAAECERDDDPLGREVGEMIWSEWFGEGYWAEKRVNPRSWASLYQQRPAPEEGIMFKREDFKYYDELPEGENWMCIDPAVSEEDDADDTAILIFRVDEFARLYLISRHIMHVTMDKWVEFMMTKAKIYKPQEIVGESGVIRRAAEPWIARAMRQLKSWYTFEWVNRHANKSAMARGAQAMVSAGQVFMPHNSDGEDMIDSCLRFPASKEDHDVDAFVNLCLRLEFIWESTPPKTVTEESLILNGGGISIKSLMPPRHSKRKSRWKRTYRMSQRTP